MSSYKATVKDTTHEVVFDEKNKSAGQINGTDFQLDRVELEDNHLHIIRDGKSYQVEIIDRNDAEKTVRVKINNSVFTVSVKDPYDSLLEQLGMSNMNAQQVNEVKAPMPGLVLSVKASPGQSISKGEPLLILEAMKMENVLKSPTNGVVKAIAVNEGEAVEKNQLLVSFES